ncbi:MAG TPA: FAD-binding oxidoreductase [Nitrososphaeraceae archaeon]|nr:FAD-binding oxidoreductase [Nitrososphaeraceae archaeon]
MKFILADELRRISKGEVLSDDWSRKIYSVDASHFNVSPSLIHKPFDAEDIRNICKSCYARNVAITARGAGTGLVGQSLSSGIVLDFTANMNKVIETGDDYVTVQPGITKGILDNELEKKGKFFPPDPASGNFCTIGGMVANNSSGPHSLGYGSTIDHVQKIAVIYADGTGGVIGPGVEQDEKVSKMFSILSSNISLIQRGYPKVSKNSCGYRLDAVISRNGFLPQKVFVASEGTLGIITSIKLRIFDVPLSQNLLVVGFPNLQLAMQSVPSIMKFSPTALEMLDSSVMFGGRGDFNSGCLLFVEFSGDDTVEVETKLSKCKTMIECNGQVLHSAFDLISIRRILESRKNALNSIMKFTVGSRKPVGLIEDTVVRPDFLFEYSLFLKRLYAANNLDYVMYGHVGNGNLHTRPIIDTQQSSEFNLLKDLAKQVFKKVISHGGTITGEHGDGLARSRYVEQVYGDKLYSLFKQIKQIFDPSLIMNPGKKVIFTADDNIPHEV